MADKLEIADRQFDCRLILGTGGFRSHEMLAEALAASGAEMCTVALRRLDPAARGSILDVLGAAAVQVLPNTAGCYTARDAVITAQLARGAGRIPRRTYAEASTPEEGVPAFDEAQSSTHHAR